MFDKFLSGFLDCVFMGLYLVLAVLFTIFLGVR